MTALPPLLRAARRTPQPAIFGLLGLSLAFGCTAPQPDPDGRGQQVGYRTGDQSSQWTSSGERGNFNVTEVFWPGSVRGEGAARVHDPRDVFIELQNKHPRPMHLTHWILQISSGKFDEGLHPGQTTKVPGLPYGVPTRQEYLLPKRVNGQPVEPSEFVVIAASRTGAFGEIDCAQAPEGVRKSPDGRCWLADYYIEDLRLDNAPFEIVLQDSDERLIDQAGDRRKRPFAGSWDLVSARSMERVQIIFNNRGNRDQGWHTYSLNHWEEGEKGALHKDLRRFVHPDYLTHTYATPGMPNSPDYSGFVSSGDFQ